jgi:hypothetical protein
MHLCLLEIHTDTCNYSRAYPVECFTGSARLGAEEDHDAQLCPDYTAQPQTKELDARFSNALMHAIHMEIGVFCCSTWWRRLLTRTLVSSHLHVSRSVCLHQSRCLSISSPSLQHRPLGCSAGSTSGSSKSPNLPLDTNSEYLDPVHFLSHRNDRVSPMRRARPLLFSFIVPVVLFPCAHSRSGRTYETHRDHKNNACQKPNSTSPSPIHHVHVIQQRFV